VALVGVHGHEHVESPAHSLGKQRVRGDRALGVDPAGSSGPDRRGDLPLLLVAKQAAVAGMGIQPGHTDAGPFDAESTAGLMGQLDHLAHPGLCDQAADLAEGHMGGHVDDPQVAVDQEHGVVGCARVVGEDLRVPWKRASCSTDRLLVDRPGHGGGDAPGHGQLDRLLDGRDCGAPCLRRDLTVGACPNGAALGLQHIDPGRVQARLGLRGHGTDPEVQPGQGRRVPEHGRIAHEQGPAQGPDLFTGQCLDRDLGAYATGVSHGDAEDGPLRAHGWSIRAWMAGH